MAAHGSDQRTGSPMTSSPLVMLASGTRGDVQPCLALATGMQKAGIDVVIAAAPRFRAFVENRGAGFAGLEGNPSDLMGAGSDAPAAATRGGLTRGFASTRRFLHDAQPEHARMLESAASLSSRARAIIVGLSSTWGLSIAEALGVPCIFCMLQPWGRTRAFPSPLLPIRVSLGGSYNAMSYRVVEQAMWQPWRRTINRWRRRTLGLPELPISGPWDRLYAGGYPCVYGISPSVLRSPPDWPADHAVTGYWFLEPDTGWKASPELQSFLSSGEKPLYIGFGSMGIAPGDLAILLEALRLSGMRALVSPGGRGPQPPAETDSPRVLFIDEVPHDWLFPRVAAVVHHGGAGTLSSALRAGVPSIVVPMAADQHYWGERIAHLGTGPRPVTRRHFNPQALASLFLGVCSDRGMAGNAIELGKRVRAENGVAQAVEALRPLIG
jgi:sterol 3beta-glucosyltransferase